VNWLRNHVPCYGSIDGKTRLSQAMGVGDEEPGFIDLVFDELPAD